MTKSNMYKLIQLVNDKYTLPEDWKQETHIMLSDAFEASIVGSEACAAHLTDAAKALILAIAADEDNLKQVVRDVMDDDDYNQDPIGKTIEDLIGYCHAHIASSMSEDYRYDKAGYMMAVHQIDRWMHRNGMDLAQMVMEA